MGGGGGDGVGSGDHCKDVRFFPEGDGSRGRGLT